jgi:signal transduction histidine kinase
VSLSLALRLAEARLEKEPADAKRLLAEAQQELMLALADLRELARGIHPAILTDRGLGAAVEALVSRAPLPVEVYRMPEERLPGPVEAAAYYVVAEGLTNVDKYAGASSVRVSVERNNGVAAVEVADDGVGGANPGSGTGLRGLADRVEALGGRLEVESPTRGGTRLRAVIPVG